MKGPGSFPGPFDDGGRRGRAAVRVRAVRVGRPPPSNLCGLRSEVAGLLAVVVVIVIVVQMGAVTAHRTDGRQGATSGFDTNAGQLRRTA